MADLERRETKSFPELLSLCKSRYDQWADELLQPFEADLPPRLVTAEFYEALSRHISPRIKETLVSLDVPIKELVESQPSVSERNSLREKIVRKVIGGDPLEDIKEEKVRRRVRSVTVDLMSALQLQGAEVGCA